MTHPCDALEGEVHLWLLDCNRLEAAVLDAYRAHLSGEERDRLNRLQNELARREFLTARGALRRLLGRYLQTDPASIVICCDGYGKPSILFPSRPQIEFNLSHSHGKVLLGFSRNRMLGVDIEWMNPALPDPAMLPMVFTPSERAELTALPPKLQTRAFFCAWTRKEAFIKAVGEGVSADLQSFSVSLDPREPPTLRPPARFCDQNWTLISLETDPGYEAALVASGGNFEIRQRTIP